MIVFVAADGLAGDAVDVGPPVDPAPGQDPLGQFTRDLGD